MNVPSNITHLSRDVRYPSTSPGTDPRPFTPRPAFNQGSDAPQRKFVAKGHDAQLQDAQYGKNTVLLTTLSGAAFSGQITRRDKFTITLRHDAGKSEGQEEIFYKHAIEGVLITRAPLAH